METVLRNADLKEQQEAWDVLDRNPALFHAGTTRLKWQMAQQGQFAAFDDWETLRPFRSVHGGVEHSSVYAVAVEGSNGRGDSASAAGGEVFRIAAIVAAADGEAPTIDTSFEVQDEETLRALQGIRPMAWRWLGLPCTLALLEYAIRGDTIFVALPVAVRLAFAARRLRRRLETADIYLVARPPMSTPLAGQSIVAPAR
jgi:hypothetical protein